MTQFLLQITFFQQGTIPCVSRDGRFIMESPYKVGSLFQWQAVPKFEKDPSLSLCEY